MDYQRSTTLSLEYYLISASGNPRGAFLGYDSLTFRKAYSIIVV